MSERFYYEAISRFEAARRVGILPSSHRSHGLHGHSFIVRARLEEEATTENNAGDKNLSSLVQRLKRCSSRIDYTLLNDTIEEPTNENLARWFRECLDLGGISNIGIQSTVNEGADLDADNNVHIWRRFRFEAAHQLPNVPRGHPCGEAHGHGFEVVLHANQSLTKDDPMGIDFDLIDEKWAPFHQQLNYKNLNSIDGLENPTSENIAAWIWERLKDEFVELSWVSVYETKSSGCHYDGENYRIWKERGFESALVIENTPKHNPEHNLHGHSYLIRLHLTAPLDEVLGWTVDYGDVKEKFSPIYKQLDHNQLNFIDGLTSPDIRTFVQWIKAQTSQKIPELDRIDLYETPGCGGILSWGSEPPILPIKAL